MPPFKFNIDVSVGDGATVNIGKRLEQLDKEVYPCDNDVSILISGETAEKLTSVFTPISAGWHKLRGRVTEIAVYKLEEIRKAVIEVGH